VFFFASLSFKIEERRTLILSFQTIPLLDLKMILPRDMKERAPLNWMIKQKFIKREKDQTGAEQFNQHVEFSVGNSNLKLLIITI
jgi:hypothetical protein